MFNPRNADEYLHREEQHERRAEALGRYRRQQFELFELDQLFPECPNCGAYAEPAFFDFGRDCASGYDDSGEGCTACVRTR